jgi:hypothetical protein
MHVVREFKITVGNLRKEKGEGITLNEVRNITVKTMDTGI